MAKKIGWIVIVLIILGGYVFWALQRPLPTLKPVKASASLHFSTPVAAMAWPDGQSAVGIVGSNITEANGQQKAVPTASTAKIITALTVLKAKPLALGQPGPTITLSPSDVAIYQSYATRDGSVVPVAPGEQISEYKMLETLLLPSANNMADSLAIWAYGSLPAYKAAATSYLDQLGLKDTSVGVDASGFSPTTTSTAGDLVKLGELAMQNPVLAEIVGQSTASGIPVANNIKNVNSLIGTDNIVGIKTGNNDQDPGAFLSASRATINQKIVTIVTAYLEAPSIFQAMKSSVPLIESAQANFKPVTVLKAGSTVAYYTAPDNSKIPVKITSDLTLTAWNGSTINATYTLQKIPGDSPQGKTVGQLTASDPVSGNKQLVSLKLVGNPAKPTIRYRLLHP